ncbi:MAG: glutaminyl-peptide cyclotransferase [Bacteroidales bacterium]
MVPTGNPGTASLRILFKLKDGKEENHSLRLRLTSDIVPENFGFIVKRTYPHDIGAYTQGLEYNDGFLYEGTGNYGESSLRKVDLNTGEILKFKNLSSDLFGEGVTLINNQIYQITYRAQVGFVYNKENFKLIRKIYYQNREGWGLTNNGEYILMSDGSHNIYFMDTTYFSVVSKIEVYDQEKEVNLLNELELINGILYANRYTTEEIVMIDPGTGKLLGRIDMNGILDASDRHPSIDYFNGIAWDEENERIFVTGKYWPKLYEVEFVKTTGSN